MKNKRESKGHLLDNTWRSFSQKGKELLIWSLVYFSGVLLAEYFGFIEGILMWLAIIIAFFLIFIVIKNWPTIEKDKATMSINLLAAISAFLAIFLAIANDSRTNKCSLMIERADQVLELANRTSFLLLNELELPYINYDTKGGAVEPLLQSDIYDRYSEYKEKIDLLNIKFAILSAQAKSKDQVPLNNLFDANNRFLLNFEEEKNPTYHDLWRKANNERTNFIQAIQQLLVNAKCA